MSGNRNTFGHCMQTTRGPWNVTPAANGIWSGMLMWDILSAGGTIPPGMKWTMSAPNASPATSTTKAGNGSSADDWIRRVQELRNASTNKANEAGSGGGRNCKGCGTTTKGRQCACNNSKGSVGPGHPGPDEIEEQPRRDQGTRELMRQRRELLRDVVNAPEASNLQRQLSAKIERVSLRIYARTGDERYNPSTQYRMKYDR